MANLKIIKFNNKIGYQDNDGNIIVKPIYDDGPLSFGTDSFEGTKYACVKNGISCGMIDEEGNEIIPFKYDEVFHLFENLFAVRKNTKSNGWNFGVVDNEDKLIIPFKYKFISHLRNFIKCYKTAQSAYKYPSTKSMDTKGHIYEYSFLFCFSHDIEWFNTDASLVYKGNAIDSKYDYLIIKEEYQLGVINRIGELIIQTMYDEIHCTAKDRFVVRKILNDDWRFGVVDNQNNIVIPFEFKYIASKNGAFYECYKEAHYTINDKNTIHPYEYSDKKNVSWYNENGLKICDCEAKILSKDYLGVLSNGKWGIYDKSNVRIVNFLYDDVSYIQDRFIIAKDGKVGILNTNAGIIIAPCYKTIECVSQDHNTYNRKLISCNLCNNERGQNGIVFSYKKDIDFRHFFILINDSYSEIFSEANGILADSKFDLIRQLTNITFAVKKNNKWGVYRADESKLIIKCEYDSIIFGGTHVVLLSKNGLWGAKSILPNIQKYKMLNSVSFEPKYKEIKILDKYELFFGVKIERTNYKDEIYEEFTIVDKKGDILDGMSKISHLDKQCQIFNYNFDMILASRKGKYGFVSSRGFVTIPFQYDKVSIREDGNFDVNIDKYWGVIDITGKEIVRLQYSERIPLSWSNSIVKNASTGRFGILAKDGSELVPSIYEHIEIENEIIFVGFNGYESSHLGGNFFSKIDNATWGAINTDGKIIVKPRYDCFKLQNGFLLAGRDGKMLYHYNRNFATDYSGVYDLYTKTGELIFGGITDFTFNNDKQIYILFFGGEWEKYSSCVDEWNNIYIHDYSFVRGIGLWLFLDKNLNSVIRDKNGEQVAFKKGTICKIEIKQQDNKKTYVYNLPINIMARGFSHICEDAIVIADNNNKNSRNYSAVEISTGRQTPFYPRITFVQKNLFFFAENKKVGVGSFDKVIIPSDYLFLTNPVKGFFFAAQEIDSEYSNLTLLSINDKTCQITAIQKIKTLDLINNAFNGKFKIEFDKEGNCINNIMLSKFDIFDQSFVNIVSKEESLYYCDKFKDIYWFSNDYRMQKRDHYNDYSDRDEPDYERDTWDAMTDGMYGDYPCGDVDYEGLGF